MTSAHQMLDKDGLVAPTVRSQFSNENKDVAFGNWFTWRYVLWHICFFSPQINRFNRFDEYICFFFWRLAPSRAPSFTEGEGGGGVASTLRTN